ncbi:hypothetical protein DPMN_084414 [Dreissena polymorpha]|uniref:Uncharacterized protein n=1 Tax=Dreissena polymorpha TaxID=45954 RepID=A0A9D3YEI4_DREPO|nr:hypothetical protein DPMN_084414 [Dreissena polymorpha]
MTVDYFTDPSDRKYSVMNNVDCKSSNVVYAVNCRRYRRYVNVGETGGTLYQLVFFPGHFSVSKSHAALPDRHAALFKGKFRHAPFFQRQIWPRALIDNIFIALRSNLVRKISFLHCLCSSDCA